MVVKELIFNHISFGGCDVFERNPIFNSFSFGGCDGLERSHF